MKKRLNKDERRELELFVKQLQRVTVTNEGFGNLYLRGGWELFRKSDLFPEFHHLFEKLIQHGYMTVTYISGHGKQELGWYSLVKRVYDETYWPKIDGIEELMFHKKLRYKAYLQTDHWLDFRERARKHAGYKCQECGKEDTVLTAHHKYYKCRGEETFDDVQVLCRSCHGKKHVNKIRQARVKQI